MTKGRDSLRAWNVETGQIVASSGWIVTDATFAEHAVSFALVLAQGDQRQRYIHIFAQRISSEKRE